MPDGQCVAAFWLVTDDVPNQEVESSPRIATWHRVVAYASLGELCNQYLSPNAQIYVEGRLNTRYRQNLHRQKQFLVEIVAQRVFVLDHQDARSSPIHEQDVLTRETDIVHDHLPSVPPDAIAPSDTDDLFARWYAARYVFRYPTDHHSHSMPTYEERIMLLRVLPDDNVSALVEQEAIRYAEDMQCQFTGFVDLIDLHTSDIRSGTTVYSLTRSSQLEVAQYIATFCRADTE